MFSSLAFRVMRSEDTFLRIIAGVSQENVSILIKTQQASSKVKHTNMHLTGCSFYKHYKGRVAVVFHHFLMLIYVTHDYCNRPNGVCMTCH